MQCDFVAPILALQTTWPIYQGSWLLVAGFSLFAWWGQNLEAIHGCSIYLQCLHSTANSETCSSGCGAPNLQAGLMMIRLSVCLFKIYHGLFRKLRACIWKVAKLADMVSEVDQEMYHHEVENPFCQRDVVQLPTGSVVYLQQRNDNLQPLNGCSKWGHSPIPPVYPKYDAFIRLPWPSM